MPACPSCFTSRFAPCFVLVKTMPHVTSSSRMMLARIRRLSAFRVNRICCSIRSTVISSGLTSTVTAFLRNEFARLAIVVGMVALKSRFCRFLGRSLSTFSISRIKPMSSIRSASSRTKNSTCVMSIWPCPIKSNNRPGVAIRTSSPFCKART